MSISTRLFSVGKKPANAGSRSALKMVQRPLRQDRLPNRIDKPTPDQDQDYPYQIIDLFSEVGYGLRSLQVPHECGSQEENDRYRSQNDSYQLIHGESSQILLWPTYFTGGRFALDRVSLRGQIARLPRRNLCSPLPLSGGSTHGLVPRDKAPWKSRQPTWHPPHGCQSGRFAVTADPRLGELAMCRPLTRGILKRCGTRITSFGTNLMRCHFIDDRTGLAVSAASSLVFGRRIAEQSSALRSPSMC